MFSKRKVKSILYMDEKRQIIESMGIDYMFDVPFTEELMKTSPEDFVTEILVRKLKMMEAVCGFNYTFGYKAAGTYDYLKEMGDKLGFAVREVKPFKVNGRVVSSTLLRNLISRGRVDRCRSYMGRNYAATGTVVKGDQLGRTMGFPTCNLDIDASMVTPPAGSYITLCKVNDKYYHAVTNVGKKPTVGKYHKNIETHILDFSGDLYGLKVRGCFLKRIRGEKKFSLLVDRGDRENQTGGILCKREMKMKISSAEILKNCEKA